MAHSLAVFTEEVSLEIIRKTPAVFPLGQKKLEGAVDPELVVGFDENQLTVLKSGLGFILDRHSVLSINHLTGKRMVKEDLDEYFKWFEDQLRKEGAYSVWMEVLSRKPLTS